MLHITQNYYLDVCPECFILQEKYITPETRTEKGVEVPNKNAGQIVWINQSFHPKHEDVVRKLMTLGLRHAVEGETEVFFQMMKEVTEKFDDIIKVKRGYERR